MEQQLDWFDSAEEFAELRDAARRLAEEDMTEARLSELAWVLVRERGAYPNQSILRAYTATPAPNRIPDYVIARSIQAILGISESKKDP